MARTNLLIIRAGLNNFEIIVQPDSKLQLVSGRTQVKCDFKMIERFGDWK